MKNLSRVLAGALVIVTIVKADALAQFPYQAWINQEDIYTPEALFRFGDRVNVSSHDNHWAILYPQGRVRITNLVRDPTIANRDTPFTMRWAHSFRDFEFREINVSRGDDIIFRQGMPIEYLRVYEPSRFVGWVNPPNMFAFSIRDTISTYEDNTWESINRYDHFEILSITQENIDTQRGSISRRYVRVGGKISHPRSVPPRTRWVHIMLDDQILTAYDEQDNLVYATLVSTGRRPGSTRRGVFQVRRKILYTTMRGGGHRPYSVEGVPFVLYFDGAIALHGAYWHDQFGSVRSHGCVNMSVTDAQWIFNFAPGDIPDGWRSIHPTRFNGNTLWVVIE